MYTATRKNDRKLMTAHLLHIFKRLLPDSAYSFKMIDRMIRFNLDINGACIAIDIDGNSYDPNTFLLSWWLKDNAGEFKNEFGNVNQYHHCKATHMAYGFEGMNGLAMVLESDIRMILDKSAFK